MTCNLAERLISAYVDRELSDDEREKVRRHLAVCSHCMEAYTATLQVKSALSSMMPGECPADLWENIERRISATPFSGEPAHIGGNTLLGRLRPSHWLRFPMPALNFAKLVIPAALAGTAIAIPLVQAVFGISLVGSPSARQTAAGIQGSVELRQQASIASTQASDSMSARQWLELVFDNLNVAESPSSSWSASLAGSAGGTGTTIDAGMSGTGTFGAIRLVDDVAGRSFNSLIDRGSSQVGAMSLESNSHPDWRYQR